MKIKRAPKNKEKNTTTTGVSMGDIQHQLRDLSFSTPKLQIPTMSQLRRVAKKSEKHWKIYLQQNIAMQGDMIFLLHHAEKPMRLETHVIYNNIANKIVPPPPKFNSSPLKSSNRKRLSSSHYFSGAML